MSGGFDSEMRLLSEAGDFDFGDSFDLMPGLGDTVALVDVDPPSLVGDVVSSAFFLLRFVEGVGKERVFAIVSFLVVV